MAQFKAFEGGIEVSGATVGAVSVALGMFKKLARLYLVQVGIGSPFDTELRINHDGWYPQEAWLEAFKNIANQTGDRVLFCIGLSICDSAHFPPEGVKDIDSAIKSIDVAYHLNHRKNGKPLIDFGTGALLDGIGHYGYAWRNPRANQIVCVSHNPYPCAFDRGVYTALARKFEIGATVVHDCKHECRARGGETCTYVITW